MKALSPFILALLILTSSIGVTINKHYCKKDGLIISFIGDVKCKCEKKKTTKSKCCHKKQEAPNEKKKGCCNEETEYVKLETDYISQSEVLDLNPSLIQSALICYNVFYFHKAISDKKDRKIIVDYPPPIPTGNIRLEIQSFLI